MLSCTGPVQDQSPTCVSLKPAFEVSVVTSSKANVRGNIGLGISQFTLT